MQSKLKAEMPRTVAKKEFIHKAASVRRWETKSQIHLPKDIYEIKKQDGLRHGER